MPNALTPRRAVRNQFRAIDAPKLFAWPTGNASALPEVLDEATYTALAALDVNTMPGLLTGTTANGAFMYRPGADEKIVGMEFCSVGGANNETQVWEFGAYGFPYGSTSAAGVTTYRPWKLLGTANFTITLGTRTLATQVADPWSGALAFSSATLRWGDTYTEATNDFGSPQLYTTGYGALDKSGRVLFDLAFVSLIAIRLTTKSATGTQELVGLWTECN